MPQKRRKLERGNRAIASCARVVTERATSRWDLYIRRCRAVNVTPVGRTARRRRHVQRRQEQGSRQNHTGWRKPLSQHVIILLQEHGPTGHRRMSDLANLESWINALCSVWRANLGSLRALILDLEEGLSCSAMAIENCTTRALQASMPCRQGKHQIVSSCVPVGRT